MHTEIEKWEKDYENEKANFLEYDKQSGSRWLSDEKLKHFIAETIEGVRQDTLKEVIAFSDHIEAEHETTFDEWRGFKHFRNALRDLLSHTEKK